MAENPSEPVSSAKLTGSEGHNAERVRRVDMKAILADPELRADLLASMSDPGPDGTYPVCPHGRWDIANCDECAVFDPEHSDGSRDAERVPLPTVRAAPSRVDMRHVASPQGRTPRRRWGRMIRTILWLLRWCREQRRPIEQFDGSEKEQG